MTMGSIKTDSGPNLNYHRYSDRLETYIAWPFASECACTPQKMAEAGFIHCPTNEEPDLAKCYVCLKELDGWQPSDDPWSEHESHSPNCLFVKFGKKRTRTIGELTKLEAAKRKNEIKKMTEDKIKEIKEYALETRQQLMSL